MDNDHRFRQLIAVHAPAVSAVSVVEVLGYHALTAAEQKHFEQFFAISLVLPISDDVVQQAVKLRQTKKMALGDALIAATALVHGRTLVTRNSKDFAWVAGLKLLNPFETP